MSDSWRHHGLYRPWNSPGQNTGVSSLSLLQGIFPTQGSNPGLPYCRQPLYQLSHKGSLIPGSIPGSGRSPGEGNGNSAQYSCLENSVDRGSWWATVQRVGHDWATNRTEHVYVKSANSCCCMAESNITLKSNYPPIKIN